MDIRNTFSLARKLVVLTCLTMFSFAVATFGSGLAGISMLTEPAPDTGSPGPADAFFPVVLFSFLIAAVFGYTIFRSRWHGWKLMLAIFFTFYGLITIMTHSESIVFLGHMIRGGLIVKFALMGGIFAVLFAPISVAVMGKLRAGGESDPRSLPSSAPLPTWIWTFIVVGAVYLIIYNVFGYFVAWKNPAVQAFYGGIDEGNFFKHLASVGRSHPWMFPFQFGRGILWGLFALPVIRMHRGGRWEIALTVALLFSIWSTQLLWPNPFMPKTVTQVHFVETATSNLLFGWIIGLLLSRVQAPIPQKKKIPA